MVAGVEAREHPPSSLKGVEQPSEATEKKKIPVAFTSHIDITELSKNKKHSVLQRVIFMYGLIPWRQEWLPTPVFSPGEFHGQRSLVGCSPWSQSDTTEQLTKQNGILTQILSNS